ncbi:putative late blight resistance protein homolog r1a-6 [Phtheirospermum japonicum]|uniref:Putative late blight resistance protein homolog r1a-6 n=1 Tax=Phtheirospermum japonicum TaxID=374723 RepID=A0A830B995_9LAMI|nr:putative late blight resistance protein homolog r1a-6 [Phtheirospermum japonicum]
MAYAAVTSLLQTLDLAVGSPPDKHLTPKDNEHFAYLGKKLMYLKGFLEDFVKKHGDHEKMMILERDIEDTVHRAEDIIETYLYSMRSSIKIKQKSKRKGYKIFQQGLIQVLEQINYIANEAEKISKNGSDPNNPQPGRSLLGNSSWHAPTFENTVVGLENDLVKFKDQLTGSPYNLEILTIVGMGGIGKSTLAKIVYDDPLTVYYFDVRAWITVSQEYQVKNILLSLIRSVSQLTDDICVRYNNSNPDDQHIILKDGINQLSDHQLAEQLYRSLRGKRYLIVMDDIWCNNAWDDLRRSFPEDRNGSRVILTSRHKEVALYVNSNNSPPPHDMRFLNVDEGWELLKLKVFAKRSCPDELEQIGKQIAEKCRGLPLAIVVVAGHLSKLSKTIEIWSSVAENVGQLVTKNKEQFLDIIAMSYNQLPHHLKACFLYTGAFPENVDIPVWRLTALWIAEGFLKRETGKSLEKAAEECLEDLIDRSLILAEKRTNERVTACRIHDLLRDFCLREAKKENFWHVMTRNDPFFTEGIQIHRRLCVHSDIFPYAVSEYSNPRVRTFLSSNSSTQLSFLTGFVFARMGFELLRVLDMISYYFSQFPIQVLKLVRLRYLALSTSGELPSSNKHRENYNGNWCLPFSKRGDFQESISDLVNLQILIVNWGYRESHCLPFDIYAMAQLRHVRLKGGVVYLGDPFKEEKNPFILSNLQTILTLSSYNLSKQIVSFMPNLKRLGILVSEKNDDFLNCLSSLHCLETLKLFFRPPNDKKIKKPSIVSRWDAFPPNLTVLTISGSHLPWEDMVNIGRIPKLEVLKLKNRAFMGQVWETGNGGFIGLKFLLLENSELEIWRATRFDFPSLRHLVLRLCDALEEVPCGIGEISTLQMIELYSCGGSAVSSAKSIQEEQQSMGNDELEVRINLVLVEMQPFPLRLEPPRDTIDMSLALDQFRSYGAHGSSYGSKSIPRDGDDVGFRWLMVVCLEAMGLTGQATAPKVYQEMVMMLGSGG